MEARRREPAPSRRALYGGDRRSSNRILGLVLMLPGWVGVGLALAGALPAPAGEIPGAEWRQCTPAEAGLDEARLHEARDYALRGGGSGCVVRGGRLVLSWGDFHQRYDIKSSTKSFGAAALGLAVGDGKMRLNDRARLHHPALGTPLEEGTSPFWLDAVTIRQLASHTAGFDKPGGSGKLLFPPGTEWSYSDSGPNWLAECITLVYRRDLNDLLFERVFAPLGIGPKDLEWRRNAYRPDLIDGLRRREFGSGISASVDALARFGLLWLRGGEWNGARILPREFVEAARSTQHGVPGLPVRKPEEYGRASDHYGLLFWNNADETIEGLPVDAFWSWGLHDSLVLIVPSLDLVAARAGSGWSRVAGAAPYDVLKPFFLPMVASARPVAPAGRPAAAEADQRHLPSPVIEAIEWAPVSTIVRRAEGSDNWPITWGDDDWLYTAYGDGNGFVSRRGESADAGAGSREAVAPRGPKLSLGLARITGSPPDWRGFNLSSPGAEALGDGRSGRKASGVLCVDGTLYLLVRNASNSQLGWSRDHGATWSWADWRFTESFGCPTFLNFGRNYAGARDGFIYVFSSDGDSAYERVDRFVLARAPKDRLHDLAAYEFFAGLESRDGRPRWTPDIQARRPVLEKPGACYRSAVTYDVGIHRYLWCQTGLGEDTRYRGGFSVYDAPEPWGPWTVAFSAAEWDVGPGETSSLPSKWMSDDGLTLHLVFSGNDSFSVRRGVIRLRAQR